MKKFNADVEKLSPRRVSRKAWYERSDSKKDDITTDKPQVMRMVFFKTSDHRVTSGDDSMNCSPQLARTFTEDDDDIFDEEPKSEEVPVAFFQAIGEKQKPEEDPAVTTFFEMMDEKLKPLDSPVHFRKLLPGNPSSRLEDDNELEEKSNLEPYPMCCWEQQSSLPSACRDDDDYESENKSNPEGDLVSSSYLGDDDEFTEKSHPELYSLSYLKQLPSSLPSGCYEDDDEFEEKLTPEENQVCHTTDQVSHAEVTLMHTQKEKWMLNKLSNVLYHRKSVNEKLFFETVTEKPKSEKDPVYAEEPLSQTSPYNDDESGVTKTAKPTLTPNIEETAMLTMAEVDYRLGAEAVDIHKRPFPKVTERRWSSPQEVISHGAFQEGGPDIEEGYREDDFTITNEEANEVQIPVVTSDKSIDLLCAELVSAEEEQRHLEEKIDRAKQRERQKAVVAEVAPDIDRRRKWFVIGAVLLLLVAVTTALAVKLSPEPEPSHCGEDGYFGPGPKCDLYYPNCSVDYPANIGNGVCDSDPYNTTECGWDGGDCLPCDEAGYVGLNCDLYYPNCDVPTPRYIGDGACDGEPYNTEECGWDGGDCCLRDYFGLSCELDYPNCSVSYTDSALIGDGWCDGVDYTEECGWEGGDCLSCDENGYFGLNCDLYYPNCSVPFPAHIADGFCDGWPYDTAECGWDGGDCFNCDDGYFGPSCELHYPNCSVPIPAYIGNGACHGKPYNTIECGWDGGDCISCDDGYFGPYCSHYYPNCSVPFPKSIGNGICDGKAYNTTECGWDGGDCLPCRDGYFGPNCKLYFPNCSAPNPEYIGDGACDYDVYDTEECGWDGGDCPH